VIPTNARCIRKDLNDVIYKTERGKFKAVVEEVRREHEKGRPVLIGTIAIEKSEILSKMLDREGIKHNVLNAKHHEREAEIIAQAGRFGAVTVSTNMAGRGTDIVLGGNPTFLAKAKVDPENDPPGHARALEDMKKICSEEQKKVLEQGGLYVVGTERHEARRIDNQLRGRTARQGDPGQTRFYVSLEDDLMRIFGAERISGLMDRLGMGEDDVIEHKFITRAIESSQRRVEGHNFDIRKHVLEYDDVMNQQRRTVYSKRKKILAGEDLENEITDYVDTIVSDLLDGYGPDRKGNYDQKEFDDHFFAQFGFHFEPLQGDFTPEQFGQKMYDDVIAYLKNKKETYGAPIMDGAIRFFVMQTLDDLWKDHLLTMDHLREGIGLRGYSQKDPKNEYKKEGYALFEGMIFRLAQQSLEKIFKVQVKTEEEVTLKDREEPRIQLGRGTAVSQQRSGGIKHETPKVGRNDPCPCGSGKKYKKCCGAGVAVSAE
jgi:preprotein translocase subunit SecA